MRCSILRNPRNKQVPLSVCWSARMLTRTTHVCALSVPLCWNVCLFSCALCKSTNRIYVNPRIEASLLPTSFQAISQLMLTEMCGRNWGHVRSLSLMFFWNWRHFAWGRCLIRKASQMIAVSLWTRQKVGCRFSDQVSSLFVFDHISKITESGLLKRQSFIFTILDLRRICLALNLLNS